MREAGMLDCTRPRNLFMTTITVSKEAGRTSFSFPWCSIIMKIGGWRTRSVFERYAIVSQADIADAIGKLEIRNGHSLGHSEGEDDEKTQPTRN